MHYLSENLKAIRKKHNLTQADFAKNLGVKRSLIGAYEEGRAEPKIGFMQMLCERFELSLDQLISQPFDEEAAQPDISGQHLRILPIAVDKDTQKERTVLVPIKAAAGYLNGYGDVEYIESLNSFQLPFPELSQELTYRVFQIEGESMLPVKSGSYVICSYLQDWNQVKNDSPHIVVSQDDGIVYKRLINNVIKQTFTLKSDNAEFESYSLPYEKVIEIWRAHGVLSFGGFDETPEVNILSREIREMRAQLESLAEQIRQ